MQLLIIKRFRLSRARNCIKDSFGILTAKCRILHRKMDFKLQISIDVVKALACLHNFLLTAELLLDEGDRMYVHENRDRQNDGNNYENFQNMREVLDILPIAVQQREILADYFISDEGRLW